MTREFSTAGIPLVEILEAIRHFGDLSEPAPYCGASCRGQSFQKSHHLTVQQQTPLHRFSLGNPSRRAASSSETQPVGLSNFSARRCCRAGSPDRRRTPSKVKSSSCISGDAARSSALSCSIPMDAEYKRLVLSQADIQGRSPGLASALPSTLSRPSSSSGAHLSPKLQLCRSHGEVIGPIAMPLHRHEAELRRQARDQAGAWSRGGLPVPRSGVELRKPVTGSVWTPRTARCSAPQFRLRSLESRRRISR